MEKKILEIIKNYDKKMIRNEMLQTFSSGSLILDQLTMIGGLPKQRIIEIFGQPSTGKTTLAIYAIKALQAANKNQQMVFLDIERTLNADYAEKCGVNLTRLIILQPKNAEETFNLIIEFLQTKLIGLIIVDSVAALLPEKEQDNKMEDNTIGLQARIMSKAMRKINYLLTENNATIIFINQIREKINKFFGNPEITSGGNALKFYASLRIQLKRKGLFNENGETKGFVSKIKIVKNKLGKPYQENELTFFYNKGLCFELEMIQLGVEKRIIIKKGNWFWYNNIKLGLGYKQTINFLSEKLEIKNKILSNLIS